MGEFFFLCRDVLQPPVHTGGPLHPPHAQVSAPPHIKPEDYDGASDWTEYQIYFEQLSEFHGWKDERKAMVLSVCSKGETWMVLAGLNAAQRHSYHAVTSVLA